MRLKLLASGKTLYQTNYAEPGTGPVKAADAQGGGGDGLCITGQQARALYTAPNIDGVEKAFLGPMCFKEGQVPPLPPPPPPPPPGFRLALTGGVGCLTSQGQLKAPITLSSHCASNDTKKWHFITPQKISRPA